MVVVTDESTALEIAEAISHVNAHAKRAQHVIGTAEYPTPWDRDHARIDALLDDWWRLAH